MKKNEDDQTKALVSKKGQFSKKNFGEMSAEKGKNRKTTQQFQERRFVCYACGGADHIARNCPVYEKARKEAGGAKKEHADSRDWKEGRKNHGGKGV
jgi:hypothetical protein